jgi:hypothetical protein
MSASTDPPELHGPVPCDSVRIGGAASKAVCISLNHTVRIRVMQLTGAAAAVTSPYHCALHLDVQAATRQGANEMEAQLHTFRKRMKPLEGAVVVAVSGQSTEGASAQQVMSMLRAALNSLMADYVELKLVLASELRDKEQQLGGGEWVFPAVSAKSAKARALPVQVDSTLQAPPLPTLPHAQWAASTL